MLAIKLNVFYSCYVGYYDTMFVNMMEHTDKLDDALVMEETEHDN